MLSHDQKAQLTVSSITPKPHTHSLPRGISSQSVPGLHRSQHWALPSWRWLTFLTPTHAHTQAKKEKKKPKRQALFKLIAGYILGKGGVSQKDKNWVNFPTETIP